MALINEIIARIPQDEEGQGLAEYALILALIAIVAIVALIFLGGQVITASCRRSATPSRSSAPIQQLARPPARPAAFVRPSSDLPVRDGTDGSQDRLTEDP